MPEMGRITFLPNPGVWKHKFSDNLDQAQGCTMTQLSPLTLEALHKIHADLPTQFTRQLPNTLYVPWDDTEAGKLLQVIEERVEGAKFAGSGELCTHIQDVLGCKIQGSDWFGVEWSIPPLPATTE